MQMKAGPGQESWEKSSPMRKQANVTHNQENKQKPKVDLLVNRYQSYLTYLTSMQSTSCKMPGWMNHKLE